MENSIKEKAPHVLRKPYLTSLQEAYDKLRTGQTKFFSVHPGELLYENHIREESGESGISLYPGSFNPLHDGHRWIISEACKIRPGTVVEISLRRWGKEDLSFEVLRDRLSQFKSLAPVLVTSEARMVGKIGLLAELLPNKPRPVFHVGQDTLERMIEDYGEAGISGLAATFVVYGRKLPGMEYRDLDSLGHKFNNCIKGPSQPEYLFDISSTQIRNSR